MTNFRFVFLFVALIGSASVNIMAEDNIFGSGFPNLTFSVPSIPAFNFSSFQFNADAIKNLKPSNGGSVVGAFAQAVDGPNGTSTKIITNINGTVTEVNKKS